MALIKLPLLPDSASYSVTDGKEVVSIELDGGAARYRRDIVGATSKVNASWSLSPEQFRYIRSFYRAVAKSGAQPFLIDLVIDGPELTEHKAYFIPGTMKLVRQQGLLHVVSAQLEIYPAQIDEDAELNYVVLFTEFGEDYASLFPPVEDELNTVVNINLPAAL